MPLLIFLLQPAFNPDPVQDTQSVLADASQLGGGVVRCPVQDVEQGARGYAVLSEPGKFPERVPFFVDDGHLVVGVPPGAGELRLVIDSQDLGTLRYAGVVPGGEGECVALTLVPDLGDWISRPDLFDCGRGQINQCSMLAQVEEIPTNKQDYVDGVRAYRGCPSVP
ncbi:MAG: hypothetical protein ACI9VR_000605 [Cognaticolwellia sp.]|jgi:hypothetical protein